jgi:hypothetical protein
MRNALESLSAVIEGFDYGVEPDDFVLYELGRLVDEDRASFEDEEFRQVIDHGIQQHIEDRLGIRAALAGRFRRALPGLVPGARELAMKVVHGLENTESDLRNVAVIVGSYTAYLFERLATLDETDVQQTTIVQAADLLFESSELEATESAVGMLAEIRSAVSARVLAHSISEPILEESVEEKAYQALKQMWPLPRPYMLYVLRSHTHEDLPFRWFQLFMETADVAAVDIILEECRMHGNSKAFREDLAAIIELLLQSRDPETEETVLSLINDPETPGAVADMLQTFLKAYRPPVSELDSNPFARRARLAELNRKYVAAAALYDSGNRAQSETLLKDLLRLDPDYPFAANIIGSAAS